ncbi:synaptic vesicle glycoprotein 2C-like isoform X2 [Spodoptera litura]|uniref:Synaptic vesicle glycoprotein 2C-like isoform X2 n=1 Tax=Spodoptera litura TaxID=69820 RepID=A0A9J7ECX8_SPOLT|nr:synaptic vesicle glycoprotein 2C-like isoform X2 [Spodoptera litura]
MMVNNRMCTIKVVNGDDRNCNGVGNDDRTYHYEEAIDLTGNGCYNYGLLAVLSLAILSMAVDIFGLSVIVTGSECDFQLEQWQKSVILSMPFVGSVLTSIPWGYISSVHGRHKALLIALWGSFVFSFISSFSVHWIMLAVLKVFSASFSSGVHSSAYALLNESCCGSVRGVYMLIMTSAMMLFVLSYVVPAYLILQFNFSYDLDILIFTSWRLLTITLAVPLGISAFFLHFYYESPKFLVNVGREELALAYLAKIWARNGRKGDYPVQKLRLNEDRSFKYEDGHILRSMWLQSVPLFRKPLLWRTLQLFYLTTIVYSVNNSLVIWMPYIIGAFTDGSSSYNGDGSRSLCSILKSTSSEYNETWHGSMFGRDGGSYERPGRSLLLGNLRDDTLHHDSLHFRCLSDERSPSSDIITSRYCNQTSLRLHYVIE